MERQVPEKARNQQMWFLQLPQKDHDNQAYFESGPPPSEQIAHLRDPILPIHKEQNQTLQQKQTPQLDELGRKERARSPSYTNPQSATRKKTHVDKGPQRGGQLQALMKPIIVSFLQHRPQLEKRNGYLTLSFQDSIRKIQSTDPAKLESIVEEMVRGGHQGLLEFMALLRQRPPQAVKTEVLSWTHFESVRSTKNINLLIEDMRRFWKELGQRVHAKRFEQRLQLVLESIKSYCIAQNHNPKQEAAVELQVQVPNNPVVPLSESIPREIAELNGRTHQQKKDILYKESIYRLETTYIRTIVLWKQSNDKEENREHWTMIKQHLPPHTRNKNDIIKLYSEISQSSCQRHNNLNHSQLVREGVQNRSEREWENINDFFLNKVPNTPDENKPQKPKKDKKGREVHFTSQKTQKTWRRQVRCLICHSADEKMRGLGRKGKKIGQEAKEEP